MPGPFVVFVDHKSYYVKECKSYYKGSAVARKMGLSDLLPVRPAYPTRETAQVAANALNRAGTGLATRLLPSTIPEYRQVIAEILASES